MVQQKAGGGAEEGSPAPPQVLEAALNVIGAYTHRRYVAVYPVSLRTVAVNDGTHINISPCKELHRLLEELLGKDCGMWLVVDTVAQSARVHRVAGAYNLFQLNNEDRGE